MLNLSVSAIKKLLSIERIIYVLCITSIIDISIVCGYKYMKKSLEINNNCACGYYE